MAKQIAPQPADAKFNVVVPQALVNAADAAADKAGTTLSDWLRRVIAKAAGRPELAETRGKGKPKAST